MISKHGLRTAFATPDQGTGIETNHLTMTFPAYVHVYEIEMVRALDPSQNPIYVKKYVDKMLVLDHLVQVHYQNRLGQNRAQWVSDGDLIWSTIPLFHATNAQTVPPPLLQAQSTLIQYINEIGTPSTLRRVNITFRQTLNLNTPVSRLF